MQDNILYPELRLQSSKLSSPRMKNEDRRIPNAPPGRVRPERSKVQSNGSGLADRVPASTELTRDGDRWLLRETATAPSLPPPLELGLVPALEKAIRIIAFINAGSAQGLALPEIAQSTGVSRSHCHAILKTLVAQGWLAFDERMKTYRLQTGILRDTSSILSTADQLSAVRPVLSRLAHQIGIPVVLSQPLVDDSFLIIDKFSTPHLVEVSFPIGFRAPRDAAAQMRANLAWRSQAEVERWLERWEPKRYTDRSPLDADTLRKEIAETRRRGYARNIGEFTEGLMALALPIFDREGVPFLIFNCASLIAVMAARELEVASAMTEAAREIHGALGSAVPRDFPSGPA
jgi:DNA-binding IclR family transcriptional regulator